MQTYRVTLCRSYFVSVCAKDEQHAKQLAEFYVATGKDDSTAADRRQHNFQIEGIELAYNEAGEVVEAGA